MMKTGHWIVAASLIVTLLASVAGADQTLALYEGSTELIELGSWGTGKIKQSEWLRYEDHEALEVETKGYFEGGRLELKLPPDFTVFGRQPSNVQVVAVVQAAQPQAYPGAYGRGWPAGPGGAMQAGPEAMPRMPGAWPGAGAAGASAYGQPVEPIDEVRIVLVTEQGQVASGALALDPNLADAEGWIQVTAVLSDFKGKPGLSGTRLLRVVLTGNREGTFYVGSLRIIQEDTPLVATILGPQRRQVPWDPNPQVQVTASFTAAPQLAGVEAAYIWDFDDLNGLGEDAYGQQVSCQFPEPGHYVITLTTADRAGLRLPRMGKVYVTVQE